MATSASSDYKSDKITVLKGLEAVRKRPAMYIGDISKRGLHRLVYEVVDNSIDESLAGFCDKITVTIHSDDSISVTDNGRGMPVDLHPTEKKPGVEVIMTILHAGGKFDKASYKVSGGLHGVGVSVVNALSEKCCVQIYRNGNIYEQTFERGIPTKQLEIVGKTRKTGTTITFFPDTSIFSKVQFDKEILEERMRELAFLNRNVSITLKDERTGESNTFNYKGGIKEFVSYLNEARNPIHPSPVYIMGEKENVIVEFSFQFNDSYTKTFSLLSIVFIPLKEEHT